MPASQPVASTESAAAEAGTPMAALRPLDRLEAAGSGSRTILVAADMLPLFDQSSGGLRLKTLIGLMGEAGWSMVFASYNDLNHQPGVLATSDGRARYEEALRTLGVVQFLYGREDVTRYLRSAPEPRWAFLSFPSVAAELLPVVRSCCFGTRVIFDMVDFHGLRMKREAELRGDPELKAEAERQTAIEICCARAADVTAAVTQEERSALLALAPDVVVDVLPNVFEPVPDPTPPLEGREGLFFVGGFWHVPNVDAVRWFADRIWPLLRRERPDLTFRIAGANASDEVLALGAIPGIEVLGYVPDLTPLFNQHRVFVAPLRYGAGMKGKVGQSLLHGLPVVSTTIGAEGMGLEDGVHALVADEPEEFAAQTLRLLGEDTLWARLSQNGREHIERTLSLHAVRGPLRALLDG